MNRLPYGRTRVALLAVLLITLAGGVSAFAQQKLPASLREVLLSYRGKEVLVMDRTGGQEQFLGGDASKAYVVTLREVASDYIVVSRNVDSDKRVFVYPIGVIRRLVTMYEDKPYERIVIEMY